MNIVANKLDNSEKPLSCPQNLFDPIETSSSSEDELEELVNPFTNKICLISPDHDMKIQLKNEISRRLSENQGETILDIGVQDGDTSGLSDADLDASITNLRAITTDLNLQCMLLRRKKVDKDVGSVAMFILREEQSDIDFIEIRIAVVGNVDAGKSTLLGVLTHGDLDNGRGQARLKLFRHKHEKETGRTSSVGNDILGFDQSGRIVNKADHGHLDWMKICKESSKVITFIDLAGHEKYLKTTVFGMTGHVPDFTMLMIGANAGVIGMTKEHLGLALALNVPVFVVITKIDMCPPNVLEETLKILMKILKSPGCRKFPMLVQDEDDAITTATNFTSERMCPVFQVSNVTGQNLNLLQKFLNLLGSNIVTDITAPAQFQIDDVFSVPGVGVVVSGTTLSGLIRVNDIMNFGPDAVGQFQTQVVKSIHRKRMVVQSVRAGQTASFSLKKVKRQHIRKGMVLLSPLLDAIACWEFEGEILVLHHPTTICARYQAMVHVGSIRQTATIVTMSRKHMRTGDKAICRFRFIKNPEYLRKDVKLIFREGRTKAVGTITKVFPYIKGQKAMVPINLKNQGSRRSRRDVIINGSE